MRWPVILIAITMAWLPVRQDTPLLRAAGAIPMAGVEGRIDHLSVDLDGQRLFVAALGNNTVEVLDLRTMRDVKSISGFHEPQGIRYLPDRRQVVVANGGDGATAYVDGQSFEFTHTTRLSGDADNVRYDATAGRVYVGYADGALAILDVNGVQLGGIRLAAHPESFQLETSGPRVFVNVPSARQIAVIDRATQTVTATWPVTDAEANYPMALDEAHHRLFVGCRRPARMLVYDTASGKLITGIDIVGDTDDLFYDAARQQLYAAGGEGFITVIRQRDADHYELLQKVQTAAGARTGLFVPELRRLFLAVPHRGAQLAEIRIYEVVN